ncbi:MAG: GIY-YIG nuclease family protein [Patescibacteria group bacterium]
MYYVYIIRSDKDIDCYYVGYSENVRERLAVHNRGKVESTQKHKPWKLITRICFSNKKKAKDFEKYLKSHSGRAFFKKRLI